MKAIFSVVMSEAAMMRSPSFSRERSSRTTMNSPFSKTVCVSHPLIGGEVKMHGSGVKRTGGDRLQDLSLLKAWIVSSMVSNSCEICDEGIAGLL